jgi:hypothetical protein
MKQKYNNTKYQGYASKKEYYRASELKLLEKAGEISNLEEQVSYELIPSQYDIINGKKKCVEKSVKYIADFQYIDKYGNLVVEDTKGMRTSTYIIKRKLMLYFHGIKIKEV